MPITIEKVKGGYQVSHGGKVSSKHTTKEKAEAQRRLLEAIKHNPNFTPRAEAAKRILDKKK